MKRQDWPKHIVTWRDARGVLWVSVVFTWHLPDAYRYCESFHRAGQTVRVGGPAVTLMPAWDKDGVHYDLHDVAIVGGQAAALWRHNRRATFTSRGCIRRCPFCAVPKIEGDLVERADWRAAPIICDSNLLATSRKHFDRVIDGLKAFKGVDFNQGLDARLLTSYHLDRLAELDLPMLRFSWDSIDQEPIIMRVLRDCLAAGVARRRLHCYVLMGFNDSPAEARYKLETIKALGIFASPMRYQPLDALKRDSYVAKGWTTDELHKMMRYWSRQVGFSKVPYEEFDVTR